MKKVLALILAAVLLLGICPVLGETVKTPYDALAALIGGKSFTLTLRAEDVDGLEEYVDPFGTVTCELRKDGESILLDASCEGEAYLKAVINASGYQVETNLVENGTLAGNWADLTISMTLTDSDEEKAVNLRISTPDFANISAEFSVTGTDVTDYVVDSGFRLMNPDGTFWNIYDTVTASGGEATRESLISIVSPEWSVEGDGEESVTRSDNTVTLSRRESYLVSLNYEEIGTLTFVSELVISE